MKKTIFKRATALVLTMVLMAATILPQPTGSSMAAGSSEKAARTVLIYLAATELEPQYAIMTEAMNKMMEARIADGINVIVLTGGTEKFNDALYLNGVDHVDCNYNQVWKMSGRTDTESHGSLTLLEEKGMDGFNHVSMEDPKLLKAFINYCAENYPAEAYDMILIDHGAGPARGYCSDDTIARADGKKIMSMAEVATAIRDSKVDRFDFVNFYACLLGNIDFATALAPYADYFIASAETLPGTGEDLKGWMDLLSTDTSLDGWELGKKIVDDTVAFYEQLEYKQAGEATMAVVNTKNLVQRLLPKICELCSIMEDEALHKGSINGKYNFYDELNSKLFSIAYSDSNLYDLGNVIKAMGICINEMDNYSSEDLVGLKNKYTRTAVEIDQILSDHDNSGDDVIYASNSSGINKPLTGGLSRGTDGVLTLSPNAMLSSSGLNFFFALDSSRLGNVMTGLYLNAVRDILAMDLDATSRKYFTDYLRAMSYYALISYVGREVSNLTASGEKDITLEKIKKQFNSEPVRYLGEEISRLTVYQKLLNLIGGSAKESWLSDIINQQLTEVVTPDRTTVSGVDDGTSPGHAAYYKVDIAGAPVSVVNDIYAKVTAELSIAPGSPFILSNKAIRGTLYRGMYEPLMDPEKDTIEEYKKIYSNKNSSFEIAAFDNTWFTICSSDGTKGVVQCDAAPDVFGDMLIPALLISPSGITTSGVLKARYDSERNTGSILGFLPGKYTLADSSEENPISDKSGMLDLSDEDFNGSTLAVIGMIDATGETKATGGFQLGNTPDRGLSIQKVSLLDSPEFVRNEDGTPKIGITYYMKDIYGYEYDITDAVTKAGETPALTDISYADVKLTKSSVSYNGKKQLPKVKSVSVGDKTIPASAYTVKVVDEKGHTVKSSKNVGAYSVKLFGTEDQGMVGIAVAEYRIKQAANTIVVGGKAVTKPVTYTCKKKTLKKRAVSYAVKRNGSGKITMTNKSKAAFKKYLIFKNNKVTIKKKAPAGRYKFTLTVAAGTNWRKTTSKVITIVVK